MPKWRPAPQKGRYGLFYPSKKKKVVKPSKIGDFYRKGPKEKRKNRSGSGIWLDGLRNGVIIVFSLLRAKGEWCCARGFAPCLECHSTVFKNGVFVVCVYYGNAGYFDACFAKLRPKILGAEQERFIVTAEYDRRMPVYCEPATVCSGVYLLIFNDQILYDDQKRMTRFVSSM